MTRIYRSENQREGSYAEKSYRNLHRVSLGLLLNTNLGCIGRNSMRPRKNNQGAISSG